MVCDSHNKTPETEKCTYEYASQYILYANAFVLFNVLSLRIFFWENGNYLVSFSNEPFCSHLVTLPSIELKPFFHF